MDEAQNETKLPIRHCGDRTAHDPGRWSGDRSGDAPARGVVWCPGTETETAELAGYTGPDDHERTDMDGNVRWSAADLDRCEHGRHSIDTCFDCPGQQSTGNLYLDPLANPARMETNLGANQRRIGTTVHGRPIMVAYRRVPDGERTGEPHWVGERGPEPVDDLILPCTVCGRPVRAGHHTEAECADNQRGGDL